MGQSKEILAMANIERYLADLDSAAQARVIRWAVDKVQTSEKEKAEAEYKEKFPLEKLDTMVAQREPDLKDSLAPQPSMTQNETRAIIPENNLEQAQACLS